MSLFSHEKCPSCVTCEFVDNNCWYVTFASEESTQKVILKGEMEGGIVWPSISIFCSDFIIMTTYF